MSEKIVGQNALEKIIRLTNEELIKKAPTNSGIVYVLDFGAVGDGVTDDSAHIQDAINSLGDGGMVIFEGKEYLISTPLTLPSKVRLIGVGDSTKLTVSDNTVNCINVSNAAEKVEISNIVLNSPAGGSNVAINIDTENGGKEQYYNNLTINTFGYGIKAGKYWWDSTVENVRANSCGETLNVVSDGTSINNLFIRFYSNEPSTCGYYLYGTKNFVFYTCNFGGGPASTHFLYIETCKAMKFIGCNFEDIRLPDYNAGIRTYGYADVVIDGCTFIGSKLADGSTAGFEVTSYGNSEITVMNCFKENQAAGITDFRSLGSSKIKLFSNYNMNEKTQLATSKIIDYVEDKVSSDSIDNMVIITQTDYDALATKDPNTLYLITN